MLTIEDVERQIDALGVKVLAIKAQRDDFRDQLSDAHQRIFDLQRALSDMQDERDEARALLHDLVMDESERRAIGGGPNWQERHAETWRRAMEHFEP